MSPSYRDNVARNTAAILAVLTLVCIWVMLSQRADYEQYRTAVYDRCIAREKFDMAANEARLVEAREFLRLGNLTKASKAFSPEEIVERDDSYRKLSAALQKAVDAQVRTSCEAFRP